MINVAANFANDASDARRGADSPARIGPQRAVASGLLTYRQMWAGTTVTILAAAALGVYLAWVAGWVIVAVGTASILALLTYTGGPWPYGYRALGELFVFIFFGLAAVVGSRYVHDSTAPAEAWLLAIPVGFLVTAILVANNVRDIDTDADSGKRTLAVILGRARTRILYGTLIGGAFVAVTAFALAGLIQMGALLALAALPLAWPPVRRVATSTDGPTLVRALRENALLHVAVGVLLAVGVQF